MKKLKAFILFFKIFWWQKVVPLLVTSMKWLENKDLRKTRRGLRIQDLGNSNISKTLNEIASPAKKSINRLFIPKSKTNVVLEPRRSSRARNLVPSYAEEFGTNLPQLRKRSRSKFIMGKLRLRCKATGSNQSSYKSRQKACLGRDTDTPNQFAVFKSIIYQINAPVSCL